MVSERPPGRLARPVVSIVFTDPPPPEPSISRTIGMRNSAAICSDIFGLPLIEASAEPPRRVKSSPAITTGRPSTEPRPNTQLAGVKAVMPLLSASCTSPCRRSHRSRGSCQDRAYSRSARALSIGRPCAGVRRVRRPPSPSPARCARAVRRVPAPNQPVRFVADVARQSHQAFGGNPAFAIRRYGATWGGARKGPHRGHGTGCTHPRALCRLSMPAARPDF